MDYLFETEIETDTGVKALEDKIQILQNQLNSLQEKVMNLEIQLKNSNSTLKHKNGPNFINSDQSFQEVKGIQSKSLSEDKIRPLEPLSNSQR
jgi:hypothetical protein